MTPHAPRGAGTMTRYVLEGVVRRYRGARAGTTVEALRVPRLEVEAGEIVAVAGPNGSGKSTLLEAMAFLQRPDEGRVLLDGRDVWAEGKALTARRRCPILLQRTVLFRRTLLQNVAYGLQVRGLGRSESLRRARAMLEEVGLSELADRGHRQLSGGERRRAALARVLALEPEVLLLDEPTAQVDEDNARLIEQVIGALHVGTGMTVILATHDLEQAERIAGRIVKLAGGRLAEEPPEACA